MYPITPNKVSLVRNDIYFVLVGPVIRNIKGINKLTGLYLNFSIFVNSNVQLFLSFVVFFCLESLRLVGTEMSTELEQTKNKVIAFHEMHFGHVYKSTHLEINLFKMA